MDATSAVKEASTLAAETQSVDALAPTREEAIREFGRDSYHEKPDGSYAIDIRHPRFTQYENDRRGRRAIEMMERRNQRSREVSFERESRRIGDVTLQGPGGERRVAASEEHRVSRKPGFMPAGNPHSVSFRHVQLLTYRCANGHEQGAFRSASAALRAEPDLHRCDTCGLEASIAISEWHN